MEAQDNESHRLNMMVQLLDAELLLQEADLKIARTANAELQAMDRIALDDYAAEAERVRLQAAITERLSESRILALRRQRIQPYSSLFCKGSVPSTAADPAGAISVTQLLQQLGAWPVVPPHHSMAHPTSPSPPHPPPWRTQSSASPPQSYPPPWVIILIFALAASMLLFTLALATADPGLSGLTASEPQLSSALAAAEPGLAAPQPLLSCALVPAEPPSDLSCQVNSSWFLL